MDHMVHMDLMDHIVHMGLMGHMECGHIFLIFIIMAFMQTSEMPFIYFQF